MGAVVFSGPFVMPEPEGEAAAVVEAAPAVVAPEAAAEVVEPPKVEPKAKASGRRRARHPAGAEEAKPGTYVADDPSTPADEAWEGDGDAAKG